MDNPLFSGKNTFSGYEDNYNQRVNRHLHAIWLFYVEFELSKVQNLVSHPNLGAVAWQGVGSAGKFQRHRVPGLKLPIGARFQRRNPTT